MTNDDFDVLAGQRVRRLRQDAGVTLGDLAVAMREAGHDWTPATVLVTEAYKRPLQLSEAVSLATVLNVSIEALAGAWTPTFADAYRAGYEKALDDVTHTITTMR